MAPKETQPGSVPQDKTGLKRPRGGEGSTEPPVKVAKDTAEKRLHVRIVNLRADNAVFNDKTGIIEEFDAANKAWLVSFDGRDRRSIKRNNLELVVPDNVHADTQSGISTGQSANALRESLESQSTATRMYLLCEALYPFVFRCEPEAAATIMFRLLECSAEDLLTLMHSEEELRRRIKDIVLEGCRVSKAVLQSSEDASQLGAILGGSENSSVCSSRLHQPQMALSQVDWRSCTLAALKRDIKEKGKDILSADVLFNPIFYKRKDEALKDVLEFVVTEASLDVNMARKPYSQTPLFYAARFGRSAAVAALLAQRADVNTRDENNETPLFYAARYNDTHVVKSLLKHRAEVSAHGRSQKTPLLYSLMYNPSNISTLLNHRADPNAGDGQRSPICYASKYSPSHLRTLIHHRADANKLDVHGRIPLQKAASIAAIKALVSARADANLKDGHGDSALAYHCRMETSLNKDLMSALIEVTSLEEQADIFMKFSRNQVSS